MAAKQFMLQGQPVHVVDGVCVNGDGTLAGSDLDMAQAVRNASAMLGIGLEVAIQMASARIAPGLAADLVQLDEDGRVTQSWIAGQDPDRPGPE
jgi:N-acetylglucosamine-6-phosphate deacetylase